MPPAGYFLCAQKVTKDAQDAQETDGFLTSFPADKWDFGKTWPKCSIVSTFAPLPLML